MGRTLEQRDLARTEREVAAHPEDLGLRSCVAGMRLADAAARSIMEKRPHLTRERAEQVRDRLCALRIVKRNRKDREQQARETEQWWKGRRAT